jgi:hypothetical protein
MRYSLLRSTVLAAVGTLVLATSVLGAKPAITPAPYPPLAFPAGSVCDFAISGTTSIDQTVKKVFSPDSRGTQRIMLSGHLAGTLTSPYASLTSNFTDQVIIRISSNGSTRVDAHGRILAFYFAGDPSELGQGLFLVVGHLTEFYAADGTLLSATASGQVTDLCATLAG